MKGKCQQKHVWEKKRESATRVAGFGIRVLWAASALLEQEESKPLVVCS